MELNTALSEGVRARNDTAVAGKIPPAVRLYDIHVPINIVAHGHIRPAEFGTPIVMTRKVNEVLADIASALLNCDDALVVCVK